MKTAWRWRGDSVEAAWGRPTFVEGQLAGCENRTLLRAFAAKHSSKGGEK
jgi:hypothetical protein